MSMYERYELLNIVIDGPVKTFRARQIQTGQSVAVHLLVGPSLDPQSVVTKVRSLADPGRQELIEFGEHEGTRYVVTTEWNRTSGFLEWLNAAADAPPQAPSGDRFGKAGSWRIPVSEFGRKVETGTPAPPEPETPPLPADPTPPTPDPAPTGVGEFTRMFEAAQQKSPQAQPPVDPVGEFTRMFEAETRNRQAPDVPQPNEPDEFTRMFQSPGGPPPQTEKKEPGEFTRMFQTPAQTPPSPPLPSPIAPVGAAEPGDFTRIFQTPQVPAAPLAASAPPRDELSLSEFERMFQPALKQEDPGSLTRTFEVPVMKRAETVPAPAPPPPTQGPGEFTRMFQAPPAPEKPTAPPAAQVPAPPLPAAAPGEFTRMFQTPAATPPPPPPAPQQTASQDRPFITPERPTRPPDPPKTGPGEFTRMFQTPAAPPPPPPAPARPAEAGEFTKFFQAPQQAPAGPTSHPAYKDPFAKATEPTAPTSGVGEFTRMFGTPVVSADPMPHAPSSGPMPPQQAPAKPQGPGDFTRMFSAPTPAKPVNPPAQQPTTATPIASSSAGRPVKKQSYVPLFLALGVLLLIAIAVIVIFALRK